MPGYGSRFMGTFALLGRPVHFSSTPTCSGLESVALRRLHARIRPKRGNHQKTAPSCNLGTSQKAGEVPSPLTPLAALLFFGRLQPPFNAFSCAVAWSRSPIVRASEIGRAEM